MPAFLSFVQNAVLILKSLMEYLLNCFMPEFHLNLHSSTHFDGVLGCTLNYILCGATAAWIFARFWIKLKLSHFVSWCVIYDRCAHLIRMKMNDEFVQVMLHFNFIPRMDNLFLSFRILFIFFSNHFIVSPRGGIVVSSTRRRSFILPKNSAHKSFLLNNKVNKKRDRECDLLLPFLFNEDWFHNKFIINCL